MSGNRCKFTSMFKCASLAHPCASVACCQTKFQVPLTAFIMHPYFGELYRHLVKHWKDCFNLKKKTNCLVTAEFCVRNQTPLFDGKIFLSNALLIFKPSKWWNQTARQIHTRTILRTNSLLASCPVFPDRMFSYNSPAKTSRLKRRAASGDSIEAALALLEIIGTSA